MTYAFGIYFEDDDNLGLVAAGNRWNSGGNSTLARRLRVAMQRRDRYGRWAEMGGGISFKGRFGNTGRVMDAVGRYVGPAEREGYMRVYVTSGRGLQTGVYEVPSKVATVAKALLSEEALKDVGVNLDVNGNQVGDVLDRDIEFFAGMFKGKPTDFELDMARGKVSPKEKNTIVKARLKAPAHKSYNIVDKNGVRIDKDEEPTKPDVKKPSKKAKPAEVFPLPDLDKDIAEENPKKWATLSEEERAAKLKKERSRRDFYVGANGKRIPDNKLTDADKTPENRRIRDLKNHRVLDGNGRLIEFIPEYKPEANPVPQGEFHPVEDPDEGFWNANQVKPGEVQKNLTTPEEVYEALYNGGFVEVPIELALAAGDIAYADLPFIGRDENPLFQSNPNDPRFREIANILSSLPPAQENRLKRAINLALMSEEKIDALKAYLEENVGEATGLSPEAFAELHKKFRNLGVDLTNMRIQGVDAFSNDNLGAERINMPQLDADDQADFLAYCDRLGINYKEAMARPQELHPIQAEMDFGDVIKIKKSWLDPELRKRFGMDDQYLFVTRDGYVLDGHHRWSSALLAEMESGKPINLKVMVLDMDHEDALKFVNEYNDHVGITRQMVGGNKVADPRPEAPKAELPTGPSVVSDDGGIVPNYGPEGPTPPDGGDNVVTPSGENFNNWLDRELANVGDRIIPEFSGKLTNDTPNPESRTSPFPGSRTVVTNLLAYRDSLMSALKESALDGNTEKFKFQFEIAKRVTKLLNKIHENFSNDKKYGADTELELSTSNPEEKLKAIRVLPETMKTEIDNRGIKRIKSFSAVIIAKNGKPFLLKWSTHSSQAYSIKPDGSINSTNDGGGTTFAEIQDYNSVVDGKPVATIAHVGGAFTEDSHHALGFGGAHIMLSRWVMHMFNGGKLQHSSNLSARGNAYSKMVSRDMRWNNRAQADKAVQVNCPNADIFKVLTDMGLVDGEYIPATPGAKQNDNTPGGHGSSSGGRGWLKRLTFTNNQGWSDNASVLRSFSINGIVSDLEQRFNAKTDEEKQAALDAMPPIFRDFFAGDKSRNIEFRFEDFDVQYNLLATAYSDGMKQQEAVDFLNTLIDGLPQLDAAFGLNRAHTDSIQKLKRLRDAIAARQWDQANNNYNRPKPFNTNSIRAIQSPFAGHFKFNEWQLPRDVNRIMNDLPFDPRPRSNGEHADWTEDPQRLQELYGPETLLASLRDSILRNKGKIANLPALSTGADGVNNVNPTAVYKALENHGYDTELILAGIYDELNGNTANTDALTAKRSELGNLQGIIEQLAREVGQLDEPVEFSSIGGDYDPASRILQSDIVKRGDVGEVPTSLQLKPLALDNESYDYVNANGGRSQVMRNASYVPQIPLSKFYIDGVADNPKIIARNFNPTGLRNALIDAVSNNRNSVKLRFPNGNELIVENAAIRDALQLQGYDINRVLSEQTTIRPAIKQISSIQDRDDVDGNGTRVTDFGIGTDIANGPGFRQKRNDGTGEFDFSLVDLTNPARNTVAQIAKIKKNADGKFEVWVAKRADGKTDEFTGEPNGVYENVQNALFDVKNHIQKELNINANTNLLGTASKPVASPDYSIVGGQDDESQITVGDMVLTKPDGAESFVVYTNGDSARGFRRIPGSEDGVSTGTVYTQTVQSTGDIYSESFKHVSKDVDGQLKEKQVFAITKIGDKFQLTTNRFGSDNLSPDRTETLIFGSYDDAKDFAVRGLINGKIGFQTDQVKNFPNLTTTREVTKPSADLPNQQITQDAASIQIVTPATMTSGVVGELKVTVQKGAHPAWRNGVVNTPYVFAEFSFSPPASQGGEPAYITGKIIRTGRSEWQVKMTGNSPSFNENGQYISGSLREGTNYESTKQDALDRLKKKLDAAFGIEESQRDRGESVLPRIRLVDKAVELEPKPEPPASDDPSLLADGVFDEFLAVRNTPLDIPDATSRGYMGLGMSDSARFETPDGKNYKVKDEGSRKAASESLNHALHLALGIPATPARTGKAPGTRNQVNLIDPFEPDIVPGRVNGNMNGQELFTNAEFNKPENQQAIADIQEGLIIDYWLGNVDFVLNSGNSFVAVRDGVRRGVRCDVGGGMFSAIGQQVINDWTDPNEAVREFKHYNNDFMGNNDTVAGSTTDGHMRRGLTKEKYVEMGRRTLLRLTDDKIDRLVDAHITDPTDNARAKQALKARRVAMLNYLGIDPNEAPPTGGQPRPTYAILPNAQLARDGYEFVGINVEGKKIVRTRGAVLSDGVFVAPIENIPEAVRENIINGIFVPENLPFHAIDRNDQSKSIVIDGAGLVRPASSIAAGYTSLIIRKKLPNGQYGYLIARPGNTELTKPHGKANANKFGPIIHENTPGQPPKNAKDIVNEIFGTGNAGIGDRVIAEKEILLDIPGLLGKQRVLVADIDDFDFSATRDFAMANGQIGPSKFATGANFIKGYPHTPILSQAPGDGDRIANKLREWEQNWHSTASNVPTESDNRSGGDDGSGPSNPGGGDGGGGTSGPPPSGSSDDWKTHSRISLVSRRPGFPETITRLNIFSRADGALAVDDVSSGNTIGHIKPLEHGHWVATFMPGLIGDNNNGNAAKAFFANKKDAENWLTKKIYDLSYADPRGGERIATTVGVSGDRSYDENAPQPPFVVERGFLNPTTPAQTRLAKRLVKGKKATPEERAMYKAILSQKNPTVGDVGWIIGQLRDREDRDSAELAASKQAQNDAVNAGNPIRESSLDNGGDGSNREHTVLAKNLQVGQRILGNINADVVFTVPGENDTINIGVVGDDGKLKVYKVNKNRNLTCIFGRQPQVAPAQQATPHPAVAARANRSRLIQEAIRTAYPNSHALPNGDLVIGQRDHRQADGRVFRYEAVVHKLKSDEFVGYVRRQLLDANGNPTGTGEAAYLTKPAHSPRALKNRLSGRVIPALMANNPANGFNQPNGDRQNEAIDPATGLPLPESLVSQTRFVGNTGIESTGHPAKDALIEYVQTLVARGVSAPEIINQVVGPNQRLFSRQQMDDIIERLEANRLYPGVNVIPYVSKDNKTIVRVGDRVTHYDAFGQPKLMANGQPRTGTVTERRPYTLNMKPNGEYEYTDQVYVQWDDTPRPHQAAPRRLEVNRRADGSDPVPAVQNANEEGTPPYIETMPLQPKRVVPRPVARRPVAPPPADSQDIANIGNVRILVVPNGPTYSVDRGDEYTQFQDVTDAGNYSGIYVIKVSNGGKWLVKERDGVDVQVLAEFDDRNQAEAHAMDLINQNGGRQTQERLETRADAPIAERGTLINANNVGEFERVVDPSGMGHTILRGANMTRFDKDQGDGIPNAIYVQQRDDGKWHVIQQMPDGNGGYDTRSVAINDDRNLMEAVATNIVAGNTTAEAYMQMWGNPNQPNAPENNDSAITPLIERFNANRMPFGFSLVRGADLGGEFGTNIMLKDTQADAAGLNSIKGRITQNENGNYVVQKWGGNGGFVGREEYPGIMTALEVLSMHALSVRLERDGNNSPESSKPSSSPSSPNGGDGGGVPPTNPPAGGDGGASDGPGLDLNMGRWRQGQPPQGVGRVDGVVPKVNTFWDDDQPPTRYDVVRDENRTKFIGRAGDNPGAEAFVYVEKTPLGNWRMVDPRERGDARYSAEYGDRNVAEAIAINKMAGREDLNQEVLGQPDSNVAPAPQTLPNGIVESRSESMTLYVNRDGNLNEIQVVALGGGKAWQVNRNVPGQATEGLSYHGTREDAEREARERIAQENAPANNAPAGPAATDSESPTSGKSDSGLRLGEFRAPDGMIEEMNADGTYSTDFRIGDKTFQRVRTPSSASYYYNGFEIATTEKNSDGTFNVKTIWAKDASDFVVARDEENALLNAQSQIWAATQDGRVSKIDGDQGPSDGGNPPAGPSGGDDGNGGNGGNGGTPPTNNPPAGPAPAAPTPSQPSRQPRTRKPVVNEVQPGDRYVRYNSRRNDKPGGERTHWDIYDKRTGKVIARATEKEVADDIAAGVRDKNGNPINFDTPSGGQSGNAPATPQANAPTAGQPTGTRTNLGDGIFSVHNENEEYGIAIRGADGKWSARVHENAVDAISNNNPISTGTYDTPEEAEAAIRKAIAERQAQRKAANTLQWQSGSDGKQYLGLDGVAGVDAENSPVYGVSPSPFGGWVMARWDSKAAKDAGAPPNSIVAQPDEEAAKNDALQQINDFLRNLTGQNPPLVNDENPTTPTNRAEQLPPGTTIQDQVDAGLTTPFNPNADLPGSNPPKA